ncbi:hypothetical protein GCM10009772_47210 [Pseudonocardia alni subsp. carboxydivorans]
MSDTPSAGTPVTGRHPDHGHEAEVGDPVCWLDRLCPDCGAMPSPTDDGGPPQTCWRCGAAVTHPSGLRSPDDHAGPGARVDGSGPDPVESPSS